MRKAVARVRSAPCDDLNIMGAASVSTVWVVQPSAGAAELGAAALTMAENDETV